MINLKKIENIYKVFALMPDWTPFTVTHIRNLEVGPDASESHLNLTMTVLCQVRRRDRGWPEWDGLFLPITFEFDMISNLELQFDGNRMEQVAGLDFMDVSDRMLERIRYHICDYEGERISFSCRQIIVKSVENYVQLTL